MTFYLITSREGLYIFDTTGNIITIINNYTNCKVYKKNNQLMSKCQ